MAMCKKMRVWLGCGLLLGCCAVLPVSAKVGTTTQRRVVELSPWERAVQGREALEGIAEGSRTRADYTRAMDGFRAVYHAAPGDDHAPDSVNAVAELLAEQGRRFHDTKSLKDAVGQYEFLRKEYPGSSLRLGALLAQGQISQNDLHDAASARERYALLVKDYPKNEMAEEARAGIESLKGREQGAGNRERTGTRDQGTGTREQNGGNGLRGLGRTEPVSAAATAAADSDGDGRGAGASSFAPMPTTQLDRAAIAERRGLQLAKPATSSRRVKVSSTGAVGSGSSAAERRGTAAPVEDETLVGPGPSAGPLHGA
jgi:N-acetylmuramoyl-L-alanine amidase